MSKRVAITGFSYRFPGTNTSRYWQDLVDGRDLVTEVDAKRWSKETLLHPNKKHPGTSYTFAAGSLGDISMFDAGFFGISPREAAQMDPQQRLLLEMSWEALENSGIKASSIRGSHCGVFIGIASADYSYRLADDLAAIDSSAATGNISSIAANRISYVFDVCGPSMAIDTACSSSMVAFHQACRSILSGECSQSFAGGICLHLHPYGFLIFSKASMLSPNGRSNAFDASGDGYVRSEGGGVFFLKDYDQAVADGNPILAVVANTTVNTDGRKSGLTVPNPQAQAALLQQAYSQAGIKAEEIDYLEAHGTGTAVGDPIEAQAIGEALGKHRSPGNPLAIGSVKSNIGHLEIASGVAGLVKALYCIRHRMVPATIGFTQPNPAIQFNELNLEVVAENRLLKEHGKLIIGVNSFGFGGSNAHVILESHQDLPEKTGQADLDSQNTFLPLLLSAKDQPALKAAALDFAHFLKKQQQSDLYDIAYNAAFCRDIHQHRLITYGSSTGKIAENLEAYAGNMPVKLPFESAVALSAPVGPVFIYSGNGAQWQGMGRQLLKEEPLFRQTIQEIDVLFNHHAHFSLEDELAGKNDDKGENRYQYTEIAQPALFAVQVGISQMLFHRGLQPVAVAGHSVGEIAAAWASGALTLEDAVEVIYHRSQLQKKTMGKGFMTAVAMGQDAMVQLLTDLDLHPALTIAGINSSRGLTIAGSHNKLTQLEAILAERKIYHKRLDIDYAFHSRAMDEIKASVKAFLAKIQPRQSIIPFYSSVTGNLLDGRKLDADYWWDNIRKPVLFEHVVKSMLAEGKNIFIEVGPHAVLRSYIKTCLKDIGMEGRIIPTANKDNNSAQQVGKACSQAILFGADFDWQHDFPSPGQFIQLPHYPWQRQRHWHAVTPESAGTLARHKVHFLLGYPLIQQELTWENQVDTRLQPNLADHVVGDATVFPGAGFTELALAAALEWHPGQLAEIEGLEIHSPLLLSPDQAKLIRLNIDPEDGSVTVKGRDHCSAEPWTVHGVARILSEPQEIFLDQECLPLPDRLADFTGAGHNLLTHKFGLSYGPAFQCLDYGWVEQESALAVFKIPEKIAGELEQSHLHPALLDCTLQLIFQLFRNKKDIDNGISFVPTRMGRIAFRKTRGKPAFARATLLRRAPHSLTGEFAVFADDGKAIAVVKDVRFRSIRLSKNAEDSFSFLDYHGIPKPHVFDFQRAAVIPYKTVQSAFIEPVKCIARTQSIHRYVNEVDPLLDILCSQFTREALQRLSADGHNITSQKILVFQQANPEIEPFLGHLLFQAEDDQSIIRNSDGWEILINDDEQTSAQDIWNSLIADYPDFFNIIHSVGRVGMHLKSILAGSRTTTEIYSQGTTPARLTGQVFNTVAKQKVGQALRTLIDQGLEILPEGRRFAIIEISEGTPIFALDACLSMDFNCCDYIFASTSVESLEATAQLQERFPYIQTRHLTAQPDQEKSTASCQLAIVNLDFTSPEETMQALQYGRTCLCSGGSLLLIGHHPCRWVDFVFGAERNHWSLSKNSTWLSNQCTAQYWQELLQQLFFANVDILDLSPDTGSGPYMLLAQLPKGSLPIASTQKAMPRSWIVLADQDGFSAHLSNKLTNILQSKNDIVIQAVPGDPAAIHSLLQETTANYGQLDGIIHLAGLCPRDCPEDTEAILEQQVNRCTTAANIIQACELSETSTTCWLITTRGSAGLLPQPRYSQNLPNDIISGDAALWGFGRTLINEASNYTVRLVDLEGPIDLETVTTALEKELKQTDNEEEIILTAKGERYAPRLRIEPSLDEQKDTTPGLDSPTISLGFQLPGQLGNLRWEASQRTLAAADEVEIEVHATGLNFRDIMYTLGLLPDEAVENGFAGPSLGLEFSGTVQSVGRDVATFAPGDKVVGFSPASFANRVVTKAMAISHIPPEISFEAAATLPSTFFTAYYALHYLARLQAGEKVLIHGGAGGVGIAAIQLAKWIGAEIYVTAGSEEKRDFLRLFGVEHIYDSRSLSFADEILVETDGQGVDVVLNSLAGEAIKRNLQVLKPFGRFLELGKRDFYQNSKIGLRPFRNNISYFGIDADQLMQAQPELTRKLFSELIALFAEGILHPLPYHLFEADDIVDAFRYMQQARQIGKVIITYQNGINHLHSPAPAIAKKLDLNSEASYLVTGGLAGFGLRTAEWLVSKGARNLVLLSRTGPKSAKAMQAIDHYKKQGVKVHAAACDVTDRKALSSLLANIAITLPPIKGIVHAAAVINDGLINKMDADQIRSVLAPKAYGAYHLHELTLDVPLDFFVLFSSATTLFGNPGQGNYVAANSCLDALAVNRRLAGLPATCVRWGAIEDVGFLARNEKIKDGLQSRMGGSPLNSAIALDILENILVLDRSGYGVLDLDWKTLSRSLPGSGNPKFSELARHDGADSGKDEDHGDTIQQMLTELSDTELVAAVIDMLKSEVGEILQLHPDKIDSTHSLYDMGLDSLMAVELVVALESGFGIRLPVMVLSQIPTIDRLAEKIIQQLKESTETEPVNNKGELLDKAKKIFSQHGAEVSDETIKNLTEDLQSRDAVSNEQIIH